MIEETARIIRIEDNAGLPELGRIAWVTTRAQVGCERCAAGKGCGSATLAQFFSGARESEPAAAPVRLLAGDDQVSGQSALAPGDIVRIGLPASQIVLGSSLIYLLPLLLMLGLGTLASIAAPSAMADLFTVVGAAIGLGLGLMAARGLEPRLANRAGGQLRILEKLPHSAWAEPSPDDHCRA